MHEITVDSFFDEIEKIAWSGKKFREGVMDEGIPLAGATLGAGLGARSGKGLTGAALGYAAGGGASLLRSKLKGEKPSMSRKMLAGGALGYGVGGLAHGGMHRATANATKGFLRKVRPAFHAERTFLHGAAEEGLPALGATLGTGIAMGTHKEKKKTAASFNGLSGRAQFMMNRATQAAKPMALAKAVKPVAAAPAVAKLSPNDVHAQNMMSQIKAMKANYGKR